jgi:hypothetical protein
MDNQANRFEGIGIRIRWIFLIGGIICLLNAVNALLNSVQEFAFMGMELGKWPYALLQLAVSIFLFSQFMKNQKLMKEKLKNQVRSNLKE